MQALAKRFALIGVVRLAARRLQDATCKSRPRKIFRIDVDWYINQFVCRAGYVSLPLPQPAAAKTPSLCASVFSTNSDTLVDVTQSLWSIYTTQVYLTVVWRSHSDQGANTGT